MKTFIFLLIVIIGLFAYILFYSSAQTERIEEIPSLEKVEKIEREILHTVEQDTPNKIESKTDMKRRLPQHTDTTVPSDTTDMHSMLTHSAESADETLSPISENITYEQLRAIVTESNPRYPKALITLDSPMRSLLPDDETKALFKAHIAETFHLNDEQIEHAMKKNRILWDWVNMLR